MNISQIYVFASIAVLAIIMLLLFVVGKRAKREKLTPLAGLAFGFVLAGFIFGNGNRLIGYGLTGVGVLLAVVDIINKSKKK